MAGKVPPGATFAGNSPVGNAGQPQTPMSKRVGKKSNGRDEAIARRLAKASGKDKK